MRRLGAIEIRGEAPDESLRRAATPGQRPGAGDRLAHGIGTDPNASPIARCPRPHTSHASAIAPGSP